MPRLLHQIVALGLAVGLQTSVQAQDLEETGSITLYTETGFSGESVQLTSPVSNLADIGYDQTVSSVEIEAGFWEVCEQAAFRGSCHVLDADMFSMAIWNFENVMASVRPISFEGLDSRDGITLFSQTDFRGKSLTLAGPVNDLQDRLFDNEARSALVHAGEWELCTGDDFDGRCETTYDSVPDLRLINLGDRISSVQIHDPLIGAPGSSMNEDISAHSERSVRRFSVSGGVQGRDTRFYAEPRVNNYPVPSCIEGSGWDCGQRSADYVCQGAGHIRAVYFDTRNTDRRRVWNILENRRDEAEDILINLLCVTN